MRRDAIPALTAQRICDISDLTVLSSQAKSEQNLHGVRSKVPQGGSEHQPTESVISSSKDSQKEHVPAEL